MPICQQERGQNSLQILYCSSRVDLRFLLNHLVTRGLTRDRGKTQCLPLVLCSFWCIVLWSLPSSPSDLPQHLSSSLIPTTAFGLRVCLLLPILLIVPGDNLTDTMTTHWSGKITNLVGIIKIDGKPFIFMGKDTWSTDQGSQCHFFASSTHFFHLDAATPVMQQKNLQVYPTQTIYHFQQNGVELRVTFSTPSIMTNLKMWSLPITYITFHVRSMDHTKRSVQIFYSHTGACLSILPTRDLVPRHPPVFFLTASSDSGF